MAFKFFRRRPVEVTAETTMTPLEAAADAATWQALFNTGTVPPKAAIRKFRRIEIAPNAFLCSVNSSAKTLVVGLCGKKMRLLMPLPMMLQHMEEGNDLLVLSDPKRLHFDRGSSGFADSLPDLARQVDALARERRYTSLITYGTSMGGFPSLRLGNLLKADRAISIGGRFAYHVTRLVEGSETVGAFDPICDCRPPTDTECYVLFSARKEDDHRAAMALAAVMPGSRLCSIPYGGHNFPVQIFKNGNLAEYFSILFDPDQEPDLTRLAALAERKQLRSG